MTSILTLENGRFSYPGHPVFADANLKVAKGEVLCILGPNGCGKTTLIDCLLGILPLDRGRVLVETNDISRLSPKQIARQIAYVPQKHDRHFSFSVMDILVMGRASHTSFYQSPGKDDFIRARGILSEFGLLRLKDRDYTSLSGGETQMVMIMRSLVQDTPLIIMDEPTAHLDFRYELVVLETIARLVKQEQRTLIMATHYPNHAFYLENQGIPVQMVFMDQQQVHQSLPPSLALTEKNIETFYRVKALVASHPVTGTGQVRQIIPLKTINGRPESEGQPGPEPHTEIKTKR